MLSRSSFTSLVVGVFAVYVAHTCWVMYGIVYTRPCPAAAEGAAGGCIWPYLARKPKLQVSGAGTALGPSAHRPSHGLLGTAPVPALCPCPCPLTPLLPSVPAASRPSRSHALSVVLGLVESSLGCCTGRTWVRGFY